jgi:hypothetical protein
MEKSCLFLCLGWLATLMVFSADTRAQVADSVDHTMTRRTETHLRYSKDRSLLGTEMWLPLLQEEDRVLYGDVRAVGDNNDNFEGNMGVGYRAMMGDQIFGGYGFFDRRVTALGSTVLQGTIGLEYIRDDWEVRSNAYLPFQSLARYQTNSVAGPYLAGNGIYVRGPGELIEEAQRGLDFEMGLRVPYATQFIDGARVYGGGYVFQGSETEGVAGLRARLEADVNKWVQIGARFQQDDQRGLQSFLDVTIRLPGAPSYRNQGLWSRLSDSPERDVDIIVGAKEISGAPELVIDLNSGNAAHILYVRNTASVGGDGTFEKPFTNLDDALASAQAHDLVYVFAGDGTSSGYDTSPTIITPDLTLHGAGAPLYFDATRFSTSDNVDYDFSMLLPAGDYPMIGGGTGRGVTIDADNVKLKGVQIDGANSDGVVINSGVTGTTLDNVRITGNNGAGLRVVQNGSNPMTLRVRDSVISGNLVGVQVANSSGGALVVDMGTGTDFGVNDIYGNVISDVDSDTDGQVLSAQGNYWGGGALTHTAGPDVAAIDASVPVANAFCDECLVTAGSFTDLINAVEGARVASNDIILAGFKGHRYINAQGAGSPELIINGVDTGLNVARVVAGDSVALQMTASSNGLSTLTATLTAANFTDDVAVRTRFLPNAFTGLIGWWDGRDIDGDGDTTDNPANGAFISSWLDKTGNGHDATASGGVRPTYDNGTIVYDDIDDQMNVGVTGYLAALTNSTSVAMVVGGAPTTAGAEILRYGSCTGLLSSRCFIIARDGTTNNAVLRLDTNAGNAQLSPSFALFDGMPHVLVTSVRADGTLDIYRDGVNVASGSYATGSGFGGPYGLNFGGPINGGLSEALLINGALSNTDRGLMEDYLSDKWGL